jgi:hypothetical protein
MAPLRAASAICAVHPNCECQTISSLFIIVSRVARGLSARPQKKKGVDANAHPTILQTR